MTNVSLSFSNKIDLPLLILIIIAQHEILIKKS